jgi:co-chaperonin GroES (HSP10)
MLRPLRDRIVVRPLERKQSEVLAVVSSEKYSIGEIVAAGPKADGVRVGERIRFGTDAGYLTYPVWVSENGEKLLVMQQDDICFVEERA